VHEKEKPITPTLPTWLILSVGVLLAAAPPARAQDDTTKQYWFDYHSHYFLRTEREFYADAGFRTYESIWRQFYARPSVRLHRGHDLHFGLGAFYTWNQDVSNSLELRPFQGLKVRWPRFDAVSFSHYGRFEQRFSFPESGDSELGLRLRYKLATRISLAKGLHLDRLYVPVSGEFFFDFGPKVDLLFRSRARFDVGLAYTQSDAWVGEFHVIVQGSASGEQRDLETTDVIFRFQVKHLLSSKDHRVRNEDLPE
jgi:hypothetical protein